MTPVPAEVISLARAMRGKFAATGLLPFIFCLSAARGEERSSALEFREILKGRVAKTGAPIPRETSRESDWAVGPLGKAYHGVIQTPHAVWLASRGELVRLDRTLLADWLGK